jgi:hypothetical protein
MRMGSNQIIKRKIRRSRYNIPVCFVYAEELLEVLDVLDDLHAEHVLHEVNASRVVVDGVRGAQAGADSDFREVEPRDQLVREEEHLRVRPDPDNAHRDIICIRFPDDALDDVLERGAVHVIKRVGIHDRVRGNVPVREFLQGAVEFRAKRVLDAMVLEHLHLDLLPHVLGGRVVPIADVDEVHPALGILERFQEGIEISPQSFRFGFTDVDIVLAKLFLADEIILQALREQ